MVTISRIRTKVPFWASIRVKILLAFFIVVALAIGIAATNLTGLVSRYLTEQRTREDTQAAENLAVSAAPLFERCASEELNQLLTEAARNLDGRLMLIDRDGKVQYDSMNRLCGQRTRIYEAIVVINGETREAYGMHKPGRETVALMSGEEDAEYVAYCAREMKGNNGFLGALLYVSRIQGMMDSQDAVRRQLWGVFALVTMSALGIALVISRVVTNPIVSLSRTMRQMGKGDLSVRARVRGSGELRELAESYNSMADQLENLDKSRNQFVSNASHELKTPLATMKIMLETMIYQPDMPEELREEFMADMNHEIDRLTGIISDLLTLTKMDNRSEKMSIERVHMSELTEQTVRLLRTAAEKKGQTILEKIEPNLTLMGDPIKLNQVLYNLIDNAMKYTPDGGKIQVLLKKEERGILWQVKDNGIGIPPEDREHIFDRFYRVDKARSRETGGTGLGLSIVRQQVNMHGGTISVESEPGKGSVFSVLLPEKPPERKEAAGREEPDRRERRKKRRGKE